MEGRFSAESAPAWSRLLGFGGELDVLMLLCVIVPTQFLPYEIPSKKYLRVMTYMSLTKQEAGGDFFYFVSSCIRLDGSKIGLKTRDLERLGMMMHVRNETTRRFVSYARNGHRTGLQDGSISLENQED